MIKNIRMMGSITLSVGLVLSLLAVLPSTTTALAQIGPYPDYGRVEKYTVTGYGADAQWFVIDENEESFAEVEMYLAETAAKGDYDYPYLGTYLDVFITQYELVEICEEYEGEEECYYDFEAVVEFSGFAELDHNDYKISKNLRTASIQGLHVEGYDGISDEEMMITVDATWTSSDGLHKFRQAHESSTDNYKYVLKVSGIQRSAEGTLDITGDIDLSLQGHDDYAYASLSKFKEGSMFRVTN